MSQKRSNDITTDLKVEDNQSIEMEEITFDMEPCKAKADVSVDDVKNSPTKDKENPNQKKNDDSITKL
jgi:hypothetical protein